MHETNRVSGVDHHRYRLWQKIDTDLTWCVNDGACERVRVFQRSRHQRQTLSQLRAVTVIRRKRRRYLLPNMAWINFPNPRKIHDMAAANSAWRCHMSGVGGMGIGVVGAILVPAGHKQGYRVVFQDKKGLAIRNGGVFSQITFVTDSSPSSPLLPSPLYSGERARVRGLLLYRYFLERVGVRAFIANRKSQIAIDSYPTTGSIPYGRADLLLGIASSKPPALPTPRPIPHRFPKISPPPSQHAQATRPFTPSSAR